MPPQTRNLAQRPQQRTQQMKTLPPINVKKIITVLRDQFYFKAHIDNDISFRRAVKALKRERSNRFSVVDVNKRSEQILIEVPVKPVAPMPLPLRGREFQVEFPDTSYQIAINLSTGWGEISIASSGIQMSIPESHQESIRKAFGEVVGRIAESKPLGNLRR